MKSEQEIREMLTERLGVGFTCDPQGDASRRQNRIERELLLDILEVEKPLCSGCAIERPEPWDEYWEYSDYCPDCSAELDEYIESVEP